jgi:NADPH:quinone reductase-like Zn-dependent oxidoreductase
MLFEEYGGPEKLINKDLPMPEPGDEEVRVKVKAFGINRAETYMRRGAWGDVARVSGIECVGEVDFDPSGTLRAGQKVAAIMGGLGRTRNGSYAEYTCVPSTNIFSLQTTLPWDELAAIPESYATAWTCLFENLRFAMWHVLVVRGGTSALGQAALNIAAGTGATILASTRSEVKGTLLKSLGASVVLTEDVALSEAVRKLYPKGVDSVLDLVGNAVLRDSLRMLKKGGRVCQAGFLGGSQPLEFNPIFDMPSGADLNFFGSFVLGTADYPLSNIPMQRIVDSAAEGIYRAKPVKVFPFEQLPDAHRLMESNQANGKIVVVM